MCRTTIRLLSGLFLLALFAQSSRTQDLVYRISDIEVSSAPQEESETPVRKHAALAHDDPEQNYPSAVCRDPGFPRKPLWERPGDTDLSSCPPVRYQQGDCFRAGWPHSIRKWATTSLNSRYSAWYVGGGSPAIYPHGRHRHAHEGTWGLDYSLWSRPNLVWMKWTCEREQGGGRL